MTEHDNADEVRRGKYADAIYRTHGAVVGVLRADLIAKTVMAVADEEIDDKGDEVRQFWLRGVAKARRDRQAAEAALTRVRTETFAEVAHAMNLVADIWERDGSDPCRVRITREYANAYRLYAEGLGAPTGSAKFRAALDHATRPSPAPADDEGTGTGAAPSEGHSEAQCAQVRHATRTETRTVCNKCGQQLGMFHKHCDGLWIEQRRTVSAWWS
jgi:hypothetical protein